MILEVVSKSFSVLPHNSSVPRLFPSRTPVISKDRFSTPHIMQRVNLIVMLSLLFSGINMCFGIKIGESETFFGSAVFWVMIAFLGFHVCIEFCLLLNKYCGETMSNNYFN